MIDYRVTVDKEGFVIEGDFPPNAVPIALPNDYKPKKRYVSYFLHRYDIQQGILFLKCISIDKHESVNEGLFIAGLNALVKCFQESKARTRISESILTKNPEIKELYQYFNLIRNKHYMHDENEMIQTTDFFLVTFEEEKPTIFNASVVWNRVKLDYHLEANKLLHLMYVLHDFICAEIDKMNENIVSDFSNKSKDELLKNGMAKIKMANINNLSDMRKTSE